MATTVRAATYGLEAIRVVADLSVAVGAFTCLAEMPRSLMNVRNGMVDS